MSTGLSLVDVEPFPRLKLMKLYYMCLEEMKDIPDVFKYKFLCAELTKFRMNIVDETLNIREIEEKIGSGLVEELIFQAHNELRLLKIVKKWKPWNQLAQEDEDDEDYLVFMQNMNCDGPNFEPLETYQHMKHEAPKRPETAGTSGVNK